MPRPDPFAALYEKEEKDEETQSILSYAVSKSSKKTEGGDDAESKDSSKTKYRSPFRFNKKNSDKVRPSDYTKNNTISFPSKFFNRVEQKNKKELEELERQEEKLKLLKKQHEEEVKASEEAAKRVKEEDEKRLKEIEEKKKAALKKAEEAKVAQKEAEAKLKAKKEETKEESKKDAVDKDVDR